MAEEKKTHEGHRQRMRKRVEQQGFDSLEPHEALEYLLYITNARKDTNQLAHDLMGRFGDFAGVLEATEEDLLTVEGVGPATARMLHLLPAADTIPNAAPTGRSASRPRSSWRSIFSGYLPGRSRSGHCCWRCLPY